MKKIVINMLASILMGLSVNFFILPHQVIGSGVAGLGMIISMVTGISAGLLIFLLNVPIFILGLMKLGRTFVLMSILSVVVSSITMDMLPQVKLIEDVMLSSIFGGVLCGVGIGFIIKFGASTGGLDIIGLILAKKRDVPFGQLMFVMNACVVSLLGTTVNWDVTFYTLLSIFVTSKVIDTIHTGHIKLTLTVVTSKGEAVQNILTDKLSRGITILDGKGGYTREEKTVLILVITRYELMEAKRLIKCVDEGAFVNITETIEVMGYFRKEAAS